MRLQMKLVGDETLGGDMWILFDADASGPGSLSQPMAVLMDFELVRLQDAIAEQRRLRDELRSYRQRTKLKTK